MALDPMVASSGIADGYLTFAGLDQDGKLAGEPYQGDYPALFAESYDNYAKQGIVPGAVNSGGEKSLLEAFMRSVPGSSPMTVTQMAEAFANYWSTVAVTPSAPAHGGQSVISVANNAASLIPAFELAIRTSITSKEMKPYFYHFINNLEVIAVSQIVWLVTEAMPPSGSPGVFPESIS